MRIAVLMISSAFGVLSGRAGAASASDAFPEYNVAGLCKAVAIAAAGKGMDAVSAERGCLRTDQLTDAAAACAIKVSEKVLRCAQEHVRANFELVQRLVQAKLWDSYCGRVGEWAGNGEIGSKRFPPPSLPKLLEHTIP